MKFVIKIDTDVPNDDGDDEKGTYTKLEIYQNVDKATDISEKDKIFNQCLTTALGEFADPIIKICMALTDVGIALKTVQAIQSNNPPQPSADGASK